MPRKKSEKPKTAEMDPRIKRAQEFKGPKSVCQCGHTGDGSNSDHHGTIAPGHGFCMKCASCAKFSFKDHTPEFKRHMMHVVK